MGQHPRNRGHKPKEERPPEVSRYLDPVISELQAMRMGIAPTGVCMLGACFFSIRAAQYAWRPEHPNKDGAFYAYLDAIRRFDACPDTREMWPEALLEALDRQRRGYWTFREKHPL